MGWGASWRIAELEAEAALVREQRAAANDPAMVERFRRFVRAYDATVLAASECGDDDWEPYRRVHAGSKEMGAARSAITDEDMGGEGAADG